MPSTHHWMPLFLSLGLLASGCSGPAAAGGDTGEAKAAAEAATKKPVKRSYETTDMPMSEEETAQIVAFCEVTIACYHMGCSDKDLGTAFKTVKTKGEWGKHLKSLFEHQDLRSTGRQLARFVKEEGLHRKSAACGEVVARFD